MPKDSCENNTKNWIEQLEDKLFQHYNENYRSVRKQYSSVNKVRLMKKIYKHHEKQRKLHHAALGTFIAAAMIGAVVLTTSIFEQSSDIDKQINFTD